MFLIKKIKLGEDMSFCMVIEDHQPHQEFIKFNLHILINKKNMRIEFTIWTPTKYALL